MKNLINLFRQINYSLIQLGFNLKLTKSIIHTPKFLRDYISFKKSGGKVDHFAPILSDYNSSAGSARGHYFHQDLTVANHIYKRNPVIHFDVGSRIDGFVAHVASYREINVLDIRCLPYNVHENIKFVQHDIMSPYGNSNLSCDSISCLHALEHFGLGRYNDNIDPYGHLKGIANITNLLAKDGVLYLSFPITARHDVIYFNAHRVFNVNSVFEWPTIKDKFELLEFSFVDDSGCFHSNSIPNELPVDTNYGCGIYIFKKVQ